MRVIARGLHRSASTISREITRHGGRTQYRANAADQQAWESAVRPKPCRLATHSELQQMVASKLMQDWSPQQVSGWLKMEYPNDESLRVSHETIYRSLFIQARGALKEELVRHLRSKRRIRRSRHSSVHGHRSGQIVDAISIRERPAEIEDRAVPGHWEGDLLGGTKNSHIATLVERHSRFTMLIKVASKDTATVVAALSQHIGKLPATLRRSLTWDRGLEMAQHKSFTVDTEVKVYFCDPQSPWWWLHESGLRSSGIQFVLNRGCERRLKSTGSDARATLLSSGKHWLVVKREPRTADGVDADHPEQDVSLTYQADVANFVTKEVTGS